MSTASVTKQVRASQNPIGEAVGGDKGKSSKRATKTKSRLSTTLRVQSSSKDEEEGEGGPEVTLRDVGSQFTQLATGSDTEEEEEEDEDGSVHRFDQELLVEIPVEGTSKLSFEEVKNIRPNYAERFRPSVVQGVLIDAVRKVLADKAYAEDKVQGWTKELSTLIKDSVKELGYARYKIISHVTIGRDGGQGAIVATKCVWDEMSDDYAFYSFSNGSLFCNAACYAIYIY